MGASKESVEAIGRAYAQLWNDQDYAKIPDLISASHVHIGPVATVEGRDEFEGLMREFTAAFPDFHVEILDMVVDGNTVFAEAQYTMTHKGEFNGIAPTDREVTVGAIAKLQVEDGMVTRHREYHNQLEILQQLGVMDE